MVLARLGGARSSGGGAVVRRAALPRARWWLAMVAVRPRAGEVIWSLRAGSGSEGWDVAFGVGDDGLGEGVGGEALGGGGIGEQG